MEEWVWPRVRETLTEFGEKVAAHQRKLCHVAMEGDARFLHKPPADITALCEEFLEEKQRDAQRMVASLRELAGKP